MSLGASSGATKAVVIDVTELPAVTNASMSLGASKGKADANADVDNKIELNSKDVVNVFMMLPLIRFEQRINSQTETRLKRNSFISTNVCD